MDFREAREAVFKYYCDRFTEEADFPEMPDKLFRKAEYFLVGLDLLKRSQVGHIPFCSISALGILVMENYGQLQPYLDEILQESIRTNVVVHGNIQADHSNIGVTAGRDFIQNESNQTVNIHQQLIEMIEEAEIPEPQKKTMLDFIKMVGEKLTSQVLIPLIVQILKNTVPLGL